MITIRAAVAHSPLPWRRELQTFVAAHVATMTVTMIRDARAITEDPPHVLLVDARSGLLDAATMDRARARDVPVIGMFDPADGEAAQSRFERLGLTHFLDVSLPVEDLAEQVESAARELLGPDPVETRFSELVAGLDLDRGDRGLLIAVGGPAGAGRTEVTVGLAAQTAEVATTIVVDANDGDPHLARRLQLAMHPNLVALIDARRSTSGRVAGTDPLAAGLARPTVGTARRPARFDVIAGLANPRDWNAVRSADVRAMIDDVRDRWSVVFATTSPMIEDLSSWVDRFAVSRGLLRDADRVIGVCEPTPHGVMHFIDWLVELDALRPGAAVDVVVNKAPRSGWRTHEALRQLREIAGARVGSLTVAPFDRRVAAAEWDGVLATSRRWRRALEPLARSLTSTGGRVTADARRRVGAAR